MFTSYPGSFPGPQKRCNDTRQKSLFTGRVHFLATRRMQLFAKCAALPTTKAKQDGADEVPCFVDQLWSSIRTCTRRVGFTSLFLTCLAHDFHGFSMGVGRIKSIVRKWPREVMTGCPAMIFCRYKGCPVAFFAAISHLPRRITTPTNPTKHHKLLRSNHWNCHFKLPGDCAFVGIYGDQEFKTRKPAYQWLVGVWMFGLSLSVTYFQAHSLFVRDLEVSICCRPSLKYSHSCLARTILPSSSWRVLMGRTFSWPKTSQKTLTSRRVPFRLELGKIGDDPPTRSKGLWHRLTQALNSRVSLPSSRVLLGLEFASL